MSKFEKFFASKNIMFIFFFIAAVMYAFKIAFSAVSILTELDAVYNLLLAIVMFCTVLAAYRAYAKHETNALNTLVGVMLGFVIALSIFIIFKNSGYLFAGEWPPMAVAWIVCLILVIILYVNHIQINSMHESARPKVLLNQILLVILAAFQILVIVLAVSTIGLNSCIGVLAVVECVAEIGLFIMIICIETRLNAYKIERESLIEEGAWTEEKKAETKDKYFNED